MLTKPRLINYAEYENKAECHELQNSYKDKTYFHYKNQVLGCFILWICLVLNGEGWIRKGKGQRIEIWKRNTNTIERMVPRSALTKYSQTTQPRKKYRIKPARLFNERKQHS